MYDIASHLCQDGWIIQHLFKASQKWNINTFIGQLHSYSFCSSPSVPMIVSKNTLNWFLCETEH